VKIKLSFFLILIFSAGISFGQTVQKTGDAFDQVLLVEPINISTIKSSCGLISLNIPITKKCQNKLNVGYEKFELQSTKNEEPILVLKSCRKSFGFFMSF